jgi:hypothetical protein
MSRTIRRTRDKKRNKSGRSHFENSYTYDWLHTGPINSIWLKVKMEGKAFEKAYWKFHGDRHNSYGFSNSTWSRFDAETSCRMKNKTEIIRYYKNEEYDVFAYNPRCLSWDR